MTEIILAFIGSIAMLIAICVIGSLVLAKDTKEFHMQFSLFKGFSLSGTFFDKNHSPEDHQEQ